MILRFILLYDRYLNNIRNYRRTHSHDIYHRAFQQRYEVFEGNGINHITPSVNLESHELERLLIGLLVEVKSVVFEVYETNAPAVFRHIDIDISIVGVPSILYPDCLQDAVCATAHVMQLRKEIELLD